MSAVNRAQAIRDSVLLIRDLLRGSITDPLTNRQSGGNFVATGWNERNVNYPLITVQQQNWTTTPLGTSTTETLAIAGFEINVWSQAERTTDSLAGSVVSVLEQNQPLMRASGLFDLRMVNMTNIDEPGKAGIHRKVIEVSYAYPSQQ
jgi:hypothetical protein